MRELVTARSRTPLPGKRVRQRLTPVLWLCVFSWSCVGERDRPLAEPMELVCRVVDAATGRAIPGARVRFDFPAVNTTSNSYQTDASGQCRIKPATSATAGPPLWCLADGYAAKKIEWDEIEPIVASNSFSVKLESGSSGGGLIRSEEHTSELQSRENLVCRLLLEKKKI